MNIMRGEETPLHPVSPPDHSLMCGDPHCPQISDLTSLSAAFCSTALQCGLQAEDSPSSLQLSQSASSIF